MTNINKPLEYPNVRTPIMIRNGVVWAWFWNGQEREGEKPVFRLRKGTEIPKGARRNGRVLRTPYISSYIQKWGN